MKAGRAPLADRVRMRTASNLDLVTKALIAVNLAVFVLAAMSGGGGGLSGATELHDRGALIASSRLDPATGEVLRGVADGGWWRLVTSGFLHYGIFHLFMNMYVLWTIGPALERDLGRVRFGLVYLAGLLGGAAGALVLSPNALTAGASGAIFGLFGAYAAGLHRRGINPLRTGIGMTLMLNVAITFAIPGISIGGHLGGLVAGALCGWFLLGFPAHRMPSWTYLVPVGVSVVSVAIALTAAARVY